MFELDKISIVRALGMVGLVTIIVHARTIWNRFIHASWRDPLLWFGIFSLWTVLATIFSVDPLESVTGSLLRGGGLVTMLCSFSWYLFVVTRSIDREKVLHHVGQMSVWLIIGLSLLAQVQMYTKTFVYTNILLITTERPLWMPRPSATLGHPLYFAITLLMLLPFAHYYLKDKSRWIYAVTMFLAGVSLYETRGRVALLVLVAWLGVMLIQKFTLKRLAIVGASIALATIVIIEIPAVHTTYLRFPSILVRLNEWQFSGRLLIARPMFGYGFETYDWYSVDRVRDKGESEDGIADRLHSLPLDTAWNIGIPGVLALMMLWGTALIKKPQDLLGSALLMSGVAYGASMLTMFDFSVTYLFFPLILALQTEPIILVQQKVSRISLIVGSILIGICFLSSVSGILVNKCFTKAFVDNAQSLRLCHTAHILSPWIPDFIEFERDAFIRTQSVGE